MATKRTPSVPNRQLHHPDDPQHIWLLIQALIGRRYFIQRPMKYHIKHRDINFFWTTGAITTDDGVRHSGKGQFAFVELIEKMYPKAPQLANAALFEQPPLIVSISLDDEAPKESVNNPEPDNNELPW